MYVFMKLLPHQTYFFETFFHMYLSTPFNILVSHHVVCLFHIQLKKCAKVYLINPLYTGELYIFIFR